MLPLSMLKWCRCYRFDDIIFEVDLPVFDISYFPQIKALHSELELECSSRNSSQNEFFAIFEF